MDRNFGGVVWTNHAMDRMRERGIKQGDAWATFNRPEQSRKGVSGNWVYYRTWGNQKIEIVAKQDEKKKWVIISVWSDPVFQKVHTSPNILKSSRTSFWRRLYNEIFKL